MRLLSLPAFVLAMTWLPAFAAAQAPSSGALGDCTVTITGAQYWRSADMMAHPGRASDGFGAMIVSVSARIECTRDARIRVGGGSVVVADARTLLHRPELEIAGHDAWDGRVAAGTPVEVSITWRDGPLASRGSEARAIVRLRAGSAVLELSAPGRAVAFPS